MIDRLTLVLSSFVFSLNLAMGGLASADAGKDGAFILLDDEPAPLTSRSPTVATGAMSAEVCDLGRIDTEAGTVVAYATQAGGEDGRSSCRNVVLSRLDQLGLDISQLMHKAASTVSEQPHQEQILVEGSAQEKPIILYLDVTVKPAEGADNGERADMLFWESIRDSDRLADYEAYLDRFGDDGIFAPLAKSRIEDFSIQDAAAQERFARLDRHSIEEALLVLGYDVGTPNGVFSVRTREAIKEWQGDRDLRPTGYLTADQAAELLAGAASSIGEPGAPAPLFSPIGPPANLDDDESFKTAAAFEAGCKGGTAGDCTELGDTFYGAKGFDRNLVKAAAFYRKGCEGSDAGGCTNLGYLYENGLGVGRSEKMAAELYRQGCEGGHAVGCSNLAIFYKIGRVVERDRGKALALFEKACDGGFGRGCSKLASLQNRRLSQ